MLVFVRGFRIHPFTIYIYIYVHRSKSMLTLIVPEEGWFGQPKYSTSLKSNLHCIGSCLKYLVSQLEITPIRSSH